MRTNSKTWVLLVLGVLAVALFPTDAHAYIDPGTGSYIIQIVIAGIMAGALALKMFWGRIKAMFSGNPAKNDSDRDPDE